MKRETSTIAGIVSEAAMLQDCSTQVSQLLPCLNFLSGSQSSPRQSCCDALKAVDAAQPVCLCELIGYGAKLSLPSQMFNSTLVLELPGLCNVGADPARCPALISGAPEGSPLPSAVPGGPLNHGASRKIPDTILSIAQFVAVPLVASFLLRVY
ncbi:unnamed protein product [Calypogeia fissa]